MDPKDREDFLKRPRFDVGDRHKKKRLEIASRWASAKDQSALQPLVTMARDPQDDPDVRLVIIRALGEIGDGQAAPTLQAILDDRAASTLHSTAITALGQIGDRSAVEALIGALEQAESSQRDVIEQTLVSLGPAITAEPLIAALGHSWPAIRTRARQILQRYDGIAPLLVKALGHQAPDVRSGVQETLVQAGPPVIPDLIAALSQEDDRIRNGAADTLAKIGYPAVSSLIEALTGQNERASQAAGRALIKIGMPAVRPLILVSSRDTAASAIAREALVSIGEPSVQALLEVIPMYPGAQDLLVQMKAVVQSFLGKTAKSDLALLHTAFCLEDQDLRSSAAQNMARIGEPALDFLVENMQASDPQQARMAEDTLVSMGERAVPALLKALSDNPGASIALDRMGGKATDPLIAAMTIEDLREPAQQVLIEKGDEIVDQLYAALDSNDEAVQQAVQQILPQITGLSADEMAQIARTAWISMLQQLISEDFSDQNVPHVLALFKKALFYGEKYLSWKRGHDREGLLKFVPDARAIHDELDDIESHELAFVHRLRGEALFWESNIDQDDSIRRLKRKFGSSTIDLPEVREDIELAMKITRLTTLEERVLPAFEKAIRLKPDYAMARCRLAHVYQQLERYQEAVDLLTQGIQLSPDFWQIYFDLGDLQKNQMDQPQAAIATYRKGLELNPNWASGYAALGAAYALSEQYSLAIRYGEKAVAMEPDNADFRKALAVRYLSSGDGIKGAQESARLVAGDRAMLIIYTNWLFHQGGVQLRRLSEAGQSSEALHLLDALAAPLKAASSGQLDGELRTGIATTYEFLWNMFEPIMNQYDLLAGYDASIRLLTEAVSIDPFGDPHIRRLLASVYSDKGRHFRRKKHYSEALRWAEQSVQIDETCEHGWFTIALIHYELGDHRQAVRYMEKAASLGSQQALELLPQLRGY